MGRTKQGVQSLRTIDMQEFGGILGDIFHKHDFEQAKIFLEELITEAKRGKDGNKIDKQNFVMKLLRQAGYEFEGFYAQMNSSTRESEANATMYEIFTYYKNMKFRRYN